MLFTGLSAYFSPLIDLDYPQKWSKHGGNILEDLEAYNEYHGEDAILVFATDKDPHLLNSTTVFSVKWIDECLNSSTIVRLGKYVVLDDDMQLLQTRLEDATHRFQEYTVTSTSTPIGMDLLAYIQLIDRPVERDVSLYTKADYRVNPFLACDIPVEDMARIESKENFTPVVAGKRKAEFHDFIPNVNGRAMRIQ